MRLTTEFKAFGREGKSGAVVVDDVVGEVVEVVAVGVVPVVLDMVEVAVLPVGVDNAAPDLVSKERYTEYMKASNKENDRSQVSRIKTYHQPLHRPSPTVLVAKQTPWSCGERKQIQQPRMEIAINPSTGEI